MRGVPVRAFVRGRESRGADLGSPKRVRFAESSGADLAGNPSGVDLGLPKRVRFAKFETPYILDTRPLQQSLLDCQCTEFMSVPTYATKPTRNRLRCCMLYVLP